MIITGDKDHKKALIEIETLWNANDGTPEAFRLRELVIAVEAY